MHQLAKDGQGHLWLAPAERPLQRTASQPLRYRPAGGRPRHLSGFTTTAILLPLRPTLVADIWILLPIVHVCS